MLSLSHLSDPIDFLATINTCQEFNEMLHSSKTHGLMPLVICIFNGFFVFILNNQKMTSLYFNISGVAACDELPYFELVSSPSPG